jgi:hypothetical protein
MPKFKTFVFIITSLAKNDYTFNDNGMEQVAFSEFVIFDGNVIINNVEAGI